MAIQPKNPSLQWDDDFEIDISGGNVEIKDVSNNGEGWCNLFVSNNDDSACTVVVILAGKNPYQTGTTTLNTAVATTYKVPSGSFIPLKVRAIIQTGTSADVINGGFLI